MMQEISKSTCFQGFPGCKCRQHGRTHVLINDPTCGYGISAQRMLSAADQAAG